jgi:hypothetical protein
MFAQMVVEIGGVNLVGNLNKRIDCCEGAETSRKVAEN